MTKIDFDADNEQHKRDFKRQVNILAVIFWFSVIFNPLIGLILGCFLPKSFPKRRLGIIIASIVLIVWAIVMVFHLVMGLPLN